MSDEFDILRAAAAGMDAQRSALDLAARNVAAAEAEGTTFERLIPRYAIGAPPDAGILDEPPDFPDDGASAGDPSDPNDLPIRFLGATPQRGAEVDAVTEMVSVLDAQRAYEENASVFEVGKRLAERTIDVGRLS
jgi:hypothetical protein